MKDFIKWLGVNEKIAKLIVWIMIIMVFLIITNAMLESIGFPNYKITYDHLISVKWNSVLDIFANWVCIILTFFTVMLLIFRVTEFKTVAKYSILYLISNIVFTNIFTKGVADVLTIIYVIICSYIISKKNYKYIVYAALSIFINVLIQSVTYIYKAKLIDYSKLTDITKGILFSDYFIIMFIIIFVKEIYLNKRSEKEWTGKEKAYSGLETSKKKVKSQNKSQKN